MDSLNPETYVPSELLIAILILRLNLRYSFNKKGDILRTEVSPSTLLSTSDKLSKNALQPIEYD